jgi:hypothetical protein
MSLLHPALIYGLGLAALPVILHFLMKQKPKRLIFPALKLIQKSQKQNSRRFRLRHLWLLLLRVGVLGLLVFALTRPSLPPANYGLSKLEWGILAGIVAAGIAVYHTLLRRWNQQQMPRHELLDRRTKARVWTTASVIAALLLGVGFPYQRRVLGEIKDPTPAANLGLPVAAVCLFDTSLSTSYTQKGKTRLDLARTLALNHLGDLPSSSRVAITDTSADNPIIFQANLTTAQTRMEALEPSSSSIPLNERLRSALQAQADDRNRTLEAQGAVPEDVRRDQFIRRVYIFTDLTKSAWSAGVSQPLKADLERLKEVDIYLIDIGELQPQNISVSQVSLSRQRISVGGSLDVTATLSSVGLTEEVTVKLNLLDAQEKPVARGEARIKLTPGTPVKFEFPKLKSLAGPVVHGEIRVDRSDPLKADDVRYFTAVAGPPTRVLIVTPQIERAIWLQNGLAPYGPEDAEVNIFAPSVVLPSKLTEDLIKANEVIWLQDVPGLPDPIWTALARHVEQGHGLVVSLGDEKIESVAYDRTAAQVCLPASLDVWKPRSKFHLRFPVNSRLHPLFSAYREIEQSWALLENEVNVARFWKVKPAGGASVLATYDDKDQSPAILEKSHGKGRVLMFTSGTHSPKADLVGGWSNRWNTLPSTLSNTWMWVEFTQQFAGYAAGGGIELFNHVCGEEVQLSLPPSAAERQMMFREPGLRQSLRTVPPDAKEIPITRTDTAGAYTLLEGADKLKGVSGFSANPRSEEFDLTRLTVDDLNEMLGPERFQLARSIEELKSNIRSSDLGQEVFPILLAVLLVFFCGEHLVANRFYDEE